MSDGGRSRVIAVVVVLLVHGTAAWVLLRETTHYPDATDRSTLRVRWIERPRPVAPAPTPLIRRALAPPVIDTPDRHADRPPASSADSALLPPALPGPTPDYLQQGAAWAADAAPPVDFRPGLTSSRVPALPGGATGGRFHMREPASPQKTLERTIGRLFGGSNYTTDPCPRIHDNVHGLLPDTSDEGRRRLAWELREYRERCRP